MNYSDLITMTILIVVPAVAAWWWIQRDSDKSRRGYGPVSPGDAGAAKRDDPK